MAEVNFIVEVNSSGGEITESTREDSQIYCTTLNNFGDPECIFNNKQVKYSYIPQAGDSLFLMPSQVLPGGAISTLSALDTIQYVNGDGSGGASIDFADNIWQSFSFIASGPQLSGNRFGWLWVPLNDGLSKGDKISVDGPHPTEGTDIYSFNGLVGYYKKFRGQSS